MIPIGTKVVFTEKGVAQYNKVIDYYREPNETALTGTIRCHENHFGSKAYGIELDKITLHRDFYKGLFWFCLEEQEEKTFFTIMKTMKKKRKLQVQK